MTNYDIKVGEYVARVIDDNCPEDPREWLDLHIVTNEEARRITIPAGSLVWEIHHNYRGTQPWIRIEDINNPRTTDEMARYIFDKAGEIYSQELYNATPSGQPEPSGYYLSRYDDGDVTFDMVNLSDLVGAPSGFAWISADIANELKNLSGVVLGDLGDFVAYVRGECYGIEVANAAGEVVESAYGFYDYGQARDNAEMAARALHECDNAARLFPLPA